tara:strand:+ start:140 stop:520 length:381 start_codon:yes stop_codon:yes gene_type:complete
MIEFGKKLHIKKRTNPLNDKDMFCELVELYEELVLRGDKIANEFQLNLIDYEDGFYLLIENLLFTKYGDWKTEIITWYIWERKDIDTGEIGLLEWTNDKTEETKEILIKCAEDLWDVLEDIDNNKN